MDDTKNFEENSDKIFLLENNESEFKSQDGSINKRENVDKVDKRREIGIGENCIDVTEMHDIESSTETLIGDILESCKQKRDSDVDKGPSKNHFEMEVVDSLQNGNESVADQIREERSIYYYQNHEFSTKETVQQQQYCDFKQMNGIIVELENKLANAYQDVKDQMNIANEWRKKMQEMKEEMNEIKLVVIEQKRKVDLFEKKQITTISEMKMLNEELNREKHIKERLSREREIYLEEKYTAEVEFLKMKQKLERTEKNLVATQHDLDNLICHQTSELGNITEHERRIQCQAEQIDKLIGQVQWLEKNKVRLEITLENMKKEKNVKNEDQEVLDNTQRKIRVLEQQLEKELKEKTLLQREKLEMEKRLLAAAELERFERTKLQGVKRDMKRMKALLKDVQAQLERQRADASGKVIIKQLKNQIEDLECARTIAVKAKHSLETDLLEIQFQLEGTLRHKQDEEERATSLLRENNSLRTLLEDNETKLCEVLNKFEEIIANRLLDHELQNQGSFNPVAVKHSQQSPELSVNFELIKDLEESKILSQRYEMNVNELTSKLKLEWITRTRLELQIKKLKEIHDKVKDDLQSAREKEQGDRNQIGKLQRELNEVKEELNKNAITFIKKNDLEKRYELLEVESANLKNDLKLALKRIEYLQSALQGSFENITLESSDSEQDNTTSAPKKKGSPTFRYNFLKTEKSIQGNDLRT